MGDFYVYIHLRADDWLPFYVGKGKGKRAWATARRTTYWTHVKEKHGLVVKILWGGLSEDEAFAMEREAIASCREYSKNTLTNLTDGGEGASLTARTDKNKQEIRDFFRGTGRLPAFDAQEERHMYVRLVNYCSPSSGTYDSSFRDEMRSIGYGDNPAVSKQEIIDFIARTGARPRRSVPSERKMCERMHSYCVKSSASYDHAFYLLVYPTGYTNGNSAQEKADILEFRGRTGRFPSSRVPSERRLRVLLDSYCNKSGRGFDSGFYGSVLELGYGRRQGIRQEQKRINQDSIMEFIKVNGRLPRYSDAERKLCAAYFRYCSPSASAYDSEFRDKVRGILDEIKNTLTSGAECESVSTIPNTGEAEGDEDGKV